MTELGKAAKHMGHTHPRDLRKIDPVPEKKPPGKAKPKLKREKLWGMTYTREPFWTRKAEERTEWFKSENARDQAYDHATRNASKWYTNYRKVQREQPR